MGYISFNSFSEIPRARLPAFERLNYGRFLKNLTTFLILLIESIICLHSSSRISSYNATYACVCMCVFACGQIYVYMEKCITQSARRVPPRTMISLLVFIILSHRYINCNVILFTLSSVFPGIIPFSSSSFLSA